MTSTDYAKPIRHRNGNVTINGTFVGTVARRIRPVGPQRPNGTYRWEAIWEARDVDGNDIVMAAARAAHAVEAVAVEWRWSRRNREV
jgi:hypothetical protein